MTMASDKFSVLRKKLTKGCVLLPGDDGFDDSLQRWSATCVLAAAAVAQPTTAEEVSEVVKFATTHGIAFNVKGGGHSTSQSSSAPSPEGMVLDLVLMRNVSVNTAAQTVTYEGGCLWDDINDALWEHGLATVGGVVSHTGVGGLILQGGFGILTGLHGLTIDVLEACEVVLADGRIVTASQTENADLLWGLRGAGSTLGVVTQFTSKAFPQGDVWGGMIIFTADKLPALVDFVNLWAATNDGHQVTGMGLAYGPPAEDDNPRSPRPPVVVMQAFHLGPDAGEQGPKYFAPLLEAGPIMQQLGAMSYPAANRLMNESARHGKRYQFGGSNFTTPLKLSTVETIQSKFRGFIESHPGTGIEDSICLFEGFPNEKIRSISVDSMAFNSRGNYYNVGLIWAWGDAKLDAEVRKFNQRLQRDIRTLGYDDAEFRDGVGVYLNYMGRDAMQAEAAFGSHAIRLMELKKWYDPSNIFDKAWKLVGPRI
ncbi:hypothetical protein GE09DRAFT_1208921 [Coniochaeta sp. 2T2.1]|nr:hypothetical protein GE09DRAFT_1208921 [Coniochaeta sp. 2T2.1]